MGADASELESFAVDLGRAGDKALKDVEKVVFKGAMNVRNGMRKEMASSKSFGALAPTINFDMDVQPNGIEAEVGPAKRSGTASRGLGFGANIAYFGTSRGGGGTVDFLKPFEEEKPRFEQAIQEVLGDIL